MNTDNEIPHGYLRVTEILKPFVNFDHIDKQVLANAADRGTRVHKLIETFVKLKLMQVDDFTLSLIQSADLDCQPYLKSFIDWYEEIVDQVLETEIRYNCDKLKISGQIDLVCTFKRSPEIIILDIKTPQSSSLSWHLQTAAYQYLLSAVGQKKADRRVALMLNKYGKFPSICEYTDHVRDEKLFMNALDLYRFFNR